MKNVFLLIALLATAHHTSYGQSSDRSSYILTPAAPQTPRINGAKVFGARAGSPFLFTVAASGKRPMIFVAQGLPHGLSIDSNTGQITGSVSKDGEYEVKLTATNALGSYERGLRIVIGSTIALTPPMGWSSWNCWGNTVSQDKVLSSAKAMVAKGLVDYGWSYINIDDGWQGIRSGEYHAIMPNAKFPDMKALTDQIHQMGLKVGIYSSPWVGTYAGHIGSCADDADGTVASVKAKQHNEYYRIGEPDNRKNWYFTKHSFVANDTKQWQQWGIDYLKYDWDPNDVYYTKQMHDALQKLNRDVVYSISNSAPYSDATQWAKYTNVWRTTGDIEDTWSSMSKIGFSQDRWLSFNGPGHWTDPDMLVVGMVGWSDKLRDTRLTVDEQYLHVSLWALLAAPLLIGCDITQLDDFTLNLLCNNEVIDINQDPLGHQAAPVFVEGDRIIYAKHLEDGSMALGFFNKGEEACEMEISLSRLGFKGEKTVRDVWRQQDLGTYTEFKTTVPSHGVTLLKVYPGNSRDVIIGRNKKK